MRSFELSACMVLLMLVGLTGCPDGSDAGPSTGTIASVVAYLITRTAAQGGVGKLLLKGTHWRRQRDRHVAFFLFRRANIVATPALLANDGAQLKVKLRAEFNSVEAFLNQQMGAGQRGEDGALKTAQIDGVPVALDLAASQVLTTDSAETRAWRTRVWQRSRRRRVQSIVWRAAAIDQAMWNVDALVTARMLHILHRRLRVVERMSFNVGLAPAQALTNERDTRDLDPDQLDLLEATEPRPLGSSPALQLVGDAWVDGHVNRMFEYPHIGRATAERLVAAGAIDNADVVTVESQEGDWLDRGTYHWHGRHHPSMRPLPAMLRVRFPRSGPTPNIFSQIQQLPDPTHQPPPQVPTTPPPPDPNYTSRNQYALAAARPPTTTELLDDLLKPEEDFRNRSWLFCDHTISLLHLEALRVELGAAAFNALGEVISPQGSTNLWNLRIANVFDQYGANDWGFLMARGAQGPHFDNALVNFDDLQVGDHVKFWNNALYRAGRIGVWGLENALVMIADSDPNGKGLYINAAALPQLTLQGHGMEELSLATFQELMLKHLREGVRTLVDRVRAYLVNHSRSAVYIPPSLAPEDAERPFLVKWAPRGEDWPGPPASGDIPENEMGPWWLRLDVLDLRQLGFTGSRAIDDAVAGIVGAVRYRTELVEPPYVAQLVNPPSNRPAHLAEQVFVPLHEPALPGGLGDDRWNKWLQQAPTPPPAAAMLPQLRVRPVFANAVPGLFPAVSKRPARDLAVVRPAFRS
jgi:hypothetical protein